MNRDETISLLCEKTFLDQLFGYAYSRCATSQDTEDLCSEIILQILKAIRNTEHIEHFYAFAWSVARRTYADFCKKRKQWSDLVAVDDSEAIQNSLTFSDAAVADRVEQTILYRRIMREIAFLSGIYREVMVQYYLEGRKVSDIAGRLGITETAVKQRLFTARNTIKKEVEKMEDNALSLRPVQLQFVGTGSPVGNDPRSKAERVLSQNLIYLCRREAKSPKEISDALGVPMPYIEDELEIQCRGENGSYGLLRRLDNGKYIANIHIVDAEEYERANGVYEKHLDEVFACLKQAVLQNTEAMLSFPFLSRQDDPRQNQMTQRVHRFHHVTFDQTVYDIKACHRFRRGKGSAQTTRPRKNAQFIIKEI